MHRLGFLANPATLVNFGGAWLFRQPHDPIGDYGPLYVLVSFGLFVACTALLLVRYRKVAR